MRRLLTLGSLTLALAACGSETTTPRTELLLVSDTDIPLSRLETLSFRIEGPGQAPRTVEEKLDADHAPPRTLALVRDKGSLGPLTLTARVVGPGLDYSRTHIVSFVPGKTLIVPLHIAAACVANDPCGDQVCSESFTCIDTKLAASSLEPWADAIPRIDAWPDAGGSDGGATSDAGTDGGDSSLPMTCDGTLTDTATDPLHCGSCENACPTLADNGDVFCRNGTCSVNCEIGFGNCDKVVETGCEATLATNLNHCGKCDTPCPVPVANAAIDCVAGACEIMCTSPDFDDCDGLPDTGCEAPLKTSADHCGGCNQPCPATVDHGTGQCVGGKCELTCDADYDNCDGKVDTGCETDLRTSKSNCDFCGHRCNGQKKCVDRVCQ